jgi:hypothetical protein
MSGTFRLPLTFADLTPPEELRYRLWGHKFVNSESLRLLAWFKLATAWSQ